MLQSAGRSRNRERICPRRRSSLILRADAGTAGACGHKERCGNQKGQSHQHCTFLGSSLRPHQYHSEEAESLELQPKGKHRLMQS